MTQYIKRVEINGLWNRHDIIWNTDRNVNILSGGNGSGKSTILHCLRDLFSEGRLSPKRQKLVKSITVTFQDDTKVDSVAKFDPQKYNVEVISTFDVNLRESEAVSKLSSSEVLTELDWQLYRLHTAYLDYQLEMSKQIIAALTTGSPTAEIIAHRILFFDIIDSLFATTDKTIDRSSNSLKFNSGNQIITPYQLSSGEKQILIILTSVLVRANRPTIMLLDEPEISLHFDWQRRLIDDILQLNPNTQLLIATHSPIVVMNGWVDCVSEMRELYK